MDPYSTHLAFTALALYKTVKLYPDLPIMECGCGDYSTPMISALRDGRTHVIYSADPQWSARYKHLAEIIEVKLSAPKQWGEVDFLSGWGLCLMDSEESVVNRATHIDELLEKCKVVVMHDARETVMPEAKYNAVLTMYRPWTWIGSNEVDVTEWVQESGL